MELSKVDILPDCRTKVVRNRLFVNGQSWVPIFCANCGKEGGSVPEDNMTFAFWLCNPCFESKGHITTTMVVPDAVFYEQLRQEQLESHGRYLNEQELIQVVQEDASPLATLLKSGR